MKLSTRQREKPEVNLTSLIDVVFLLLVFFMVTTSFQRESSVSIQLPEASSDPVEVPVDREVLEITITADGQFFVNNRELVNGAPDTLRRAIEETVQGNNRMPVTIIADADARHQSVIRAMDVTAALGFSAVNLATVNSQDD
ncbi:MAG: biopolymer transporter ExbD [Pseudomonadota bacterium]